MLRFLKAMSKNMKAATSTNTEIIIQNTNANPPCFPVTKSTQTSYTLNSLDTFVCGLEQVYASLSSSSLKSTNY